MNGMGRDGLSPEERAELVAWIKAQARKGVEQLHARSAITVPKAKPLTDAQSAAIARKKLEAEGGHP